MTNNNFQSHVINAPFEPYEGDEPYIFISYKHSDWEIVYPVIKKLHEAGFNIWYDVNLPKGRNYDIQIANHIIKSKLFVTFITEEVMSCSNDEDDYLIKEFTVANNSKIKRLPIYLEDVQLSGFYLMHYLGRQSIFKHEYDNNEDMFIDSCISAFKSFGLEPNKIYSKNKTPIDPPFEPYEGDEPYVFVSFRPNDQKVVFPVIKKLHEIGFNIWYDDYPKTTNTKKRVLEIITHINKSSLFVTFITEEISKILDDNENNFLEELNIAQESNVICLPIYLNDVELDYIFDEHYFNNQSIFKHEYGNNEDMFIRACESAFKSFGLEPNEIEESK